MGLCFSEFGRRVRQNASQGTDHGTAAPSFLFGRPITGGMHGGHPSLENLDQGDLEHLIDYRQIYATLLEQWLAADAASVLGAKFATLPLFDLPTAVADYPNAPQEFGLPQNYPNPFNPSTTIEYSLPYSVHARLTVVNGLGQEVGVLADGRQTAGWHRVVWRANGHAAGTYFYRLRAGDFEQTRKMSLVK